MELRLLKHFITVAEELHFSKAASRIHFTQPALSKQTKNKTASGSKRYPVSRLETLLSVDDENHGKAVIFAAWFGPRTERKCGS